MAQINRPDEYFNTKLYSGTGSSQSITGVGFQPQMLWIKGRTNAFDHRLADIVRGTPNLLYPNISDAETADANNISSIDSDGFSLGTGNAVNQSGQTFVSWNWLAGGTASSNTDGSITSNVSANTTSGFSIVSYTGTGANATVGHGLGTPLSMVIIKDRSSASGWMVGHTSIGWTSKLALESTSASNTNIIHWNNTAPTSSVFSLGTGGDANASGDNFIAYCFAEKKGFSKFGSYTGNGNADGTFVYTGMRPAMVILKVTSASGYTWILYDNKRNEFNVNDKTLQPNQSIAESTLNGNCDFLSNGFKLRTTDGNNNGSGLNIIYMAFSEFPLVGTNNVVGCAR